MRTVPWGRRVSVPGQGLVLVLGPLLMDAWEGRTLVKDTGNGTKTDSSHQRRGQPWGPDPGQGSLAVRPRDQAGPLCHSRAWKRLRWGLGMGNFGLEMGAAQS